MKGVQISSTEHELGTKVMKLMAELQKTDDPRYVELNDVFQEASRKHSSEYPTSFVNRALTEAFKDLAEHIKSNYLDLYQERIA